MKLLRRLAWRIRNLVSRQSGQERFLEEMEQHLIRLTEENVRLGMSPEEARRQAVLKFGAAGAIREQYHAEKSLPLIESAAQDVRYAARILRRSWGFTAIAATSLALAIGANTTIFSVMKHVLLERLEVPHADQLRLLHWHGDRNVAVNTIWGIPDPGSGGLGGTSFSYPAFEELRRDNRVLEDLFAFKDLGTVNATIEGNAQVVQVEAVSGNFFDQMDVQPELGRPVQAPDDRAGAPPVALISAGLWARAFGSSPQVLGRTVKLNMVPVTIIGVTPQGFTGAKGAQSAPGLFYSSERATACGAVGQKRIADWGFESGGVVAEHHGPGEARDPGRGGAGGPGCAPDSAGAREPAARREQDNAEAGCAGRKPRTVCVEADVCEAGERTDGRWWPWCCCWPARISRACCWRGQRRGSARLECGWRWEQDVRGFCAAC